MRLRTVFILAGALAGTAAAEKPLPDSSLYQLASAWHRDDGKAMRLAGLGGKVRILSLFYTECENLCPMILGQLKSLETAMPQALRDSVGFVLVTLDPKEDSPAALRKYRKASHLPADRWTLLRGNADDTRELAALLGVRYTPKDDAGRMGHNGMVAILDRSGSVLLKTPGIQDQAGFIDALRRAVAGKP